MDELKRCPFCGESPICGVDFYESCGGAVKLQAVVKCTSCGTSKRVVFNATDVNLVPFWDYEKAFDKVRDEWNRRADG